MGYGSRALQCLNAYYSGEYVDLSEHEQAEPVYQNPNAVDKVSRYAGFQTRLTPLHTECEPT